MVVVVVVVVFSEASKERSAVLSVPPPSTSELVGGLLGRARPLDAKLSNPPSAQYTRDMFTVSRCLPPHAYLLLTVVFIEVFIYPPTPPLGPARL